MSQRDPRELRLASPQAINSGRAQKNRVNDAASAERNQRRRLDIDPQPSNLQVEPVAALWPSPPPPPPPPQPQPTYTCAVCLGVIINETTTKCGHIFCDTCIKSAISALGTCPVCRRRTTLRDLKRIYFADPL